MREIDIIRPISSINSIFLLQALQLAKQRRGFCAPNPAVGALVVKDEQILATGYHEAAGLPHAEADALGKLNAQQAQGATLYVTLEPCCHWGKTPPCTELIQKMGIKQVIYAYTDPNPQVAGQGAAHLQQAGIACQQIALPEITRFYQSYHYWHQTGLPWVTAKLALSLDGKIAGPNGQPVAITGTELKRYTHEQRLQADAILTTATTIKQDDPELNVRLDGKLFSKPIYILDRQLSLTAQERIFTTAATVTLLHGSSAKPQQLACLQAKGIRLIPVSEQAERLDLKQVLQYIGQDGIHDLWVEAGGQCWQALLTEHLLQRALIYVAPKVMGANALPAFTEAIDLIAKAKHIQWQSFEQDVCCCIDFA